MATTVRCTSCGQDVPPPVGPDSRCPVCQAPLAARTASRSGVAAAQPPTLPRQPAAAAPPPARPARPPAAKSTDAKGGIPILPIAVGVVLILAIATYAMTRVSPGTQSGQASANAQLRVQTVGRPPESGQPAAPEAESTRAVVVIDLPEDRIPVSREQRRAAERKAAERQARPERPAAAPAREVARNEKPAAVAHAAPAQAPAPVPVAEPEPAPLPPPQPAPAPPQEPPTSSAPLAVGPNPTPSTAGYQKPRLTTPGCVAVSLQLRKDIDDFTGKSAIVRFLVDATGQVSQFSVVQGSTDTRMANAIWSSIQRCDWTPGLNAQGKPVALPVTMPFSFGQ